MQVYTFYTYFWRTDVSRRTPDGSLFCARIVWNVLAILLKLGCPSQNSAFDFGNYACDCHQYVYHAQSINTNYGTSRFKSLFFLIQSSLSCIISWRHAGHGLEYGSPVSNHVIRQACQARAQVYVNIFVCMLLLWYSSVQRMQLEITVMLKFHLIKNTLFMSVYK